MNKLYTSLHTKNNLNMIDAVKDYFLQLQQNIHLALEAQDGSGQFIRDEWVREEGGGGVTYVLENGKIFEKAGVNFSHIHGSSLPTTASIQRPGLANCAFEALGISLVIHPNNPYVPTSH